MTIGGCIRSGRDEYRSGRDEYSCAMAMEVVSGRVGKFLEFLPRSDGGLEADWVHMPDRGDTVDPCCEGKAAI